VSVELYLTGSGKGKAIPVAGRGDPKGCDTSSLLHFLDNRLTVGGEVFSLTHLTSSGHIE
jgi:hypothetical protein